MAVAEGSSPEASTTPVVDAAIADTTPVTTPDATAAPSTAEKTTDANEAPIDLKTVLTKVVEKTRAENGQSSEPEKEGEAKAAPEGEMTDKTAAEKPEGKAD